MPSNPSFIGSQLMESLDLLSEVDSLTSLLLKELLYFEVFVRIDDLSSLAKAFRVCKRWSKAAKLQTFWEALTRFHFANDFSRHPNYEKPEGRDWIWVFKSKHIKSDATTFTGVGSWTYPNGDKFEGEFEDGYRHGVGVYYYKLGGMYIGNWEYGPKKGKGTFFWSHGDRYDGDWLNGDRVGQGVYIWANGNVYQGGFANNKQHQYGEFKEPNGWKICAQWNDGIPILANIDIGTETDLTLLGKEEDQQPQHQSHQNQQHQLQYQQQKETPQKWHENQEYCSAFNPVVAEAIRRGVCTYALTGTKMFGQVLWETQELDTRRHGVCIVCRDNCVPKNGLRVQQKPAFGGNFFCDCGYNFHKGVTCFSLVKD